MPAAPPTLGPSLLDRLIDASMGESKPGAARMDRLVEDITDLLNTCCVAPEESLAAHPEAADSLLAYGTPAPQSLAISSHEQRLSVARTIERVLKRHEPRLVNVKVHVEDARPTANEGRLRIHASLHAAPQQWLDLAIRVRASSGRLHVTTER